MTSCLSACLCGGGGTSQKDSVRISWPVEARSQRPYSAGSQTAIERSGTARRISDSELSAQREKSRQIDRELQVAEKALSQQVKILLLGAGESGKTTVLKQMRLIHTAGFTTKEREQWRAIVFANILTAMRDALHAMEALELTFERAENDEFVDLIVAERELSFTEPLPPEYFPALHSLWRDDGVQTAVRRGNEYALHDNCNYFYAALERLFRPTYMPTDQDILRCRMKTTGIHETAFHLRDLTYRMFDVGGQRSERKKWIHCFENVTSILFLANAAGYDQVLEEARAATPVESNQMREAIMLFDSIANSQWFVRTSMILFLNKVDLLRAKLKTNGGLQHVRRFFPELPRDQSEGLPGDRPPPSIRDSLKLDFEVERTLEFFRSRFVQKNSLAKDRDVYTHYTNATDTTLLRSVMLSVTDTILQRNLQTMAL